MPLYESPDYIGRSMRGLEGASKTTASMDKKTFEPPKNLATGAMGAGMAGLGTAAGLTALGGTAATMATPVGWVAAGLALTSYFFG